MKQVSKKSLSILKVTSIVVGSIIGFFLLMWWIGTTWSYIDRQMLFVAVFSGLFFGSIGWSIGNYQKQKDKEDEDS